MSIFGFGTSVDFVVDFEGDSDRPVFTSNDPSSNEAELCTPSPIFAHDEPLKGYVTAVVDSKKKVDHAGLKLEFIGQIESTRDRSNKFEFTSSVRELEKAGAVEHDKQYAFDFTSVEKEHESYKGKNVELRYFLRVTMTRSYASNVVKEFDLVVQKLGEAPEINNTIKLEVGIEDCLHIEFEYDKSKYHLNDIVVGKVFFLLVRIKIKHMELAIVRRESCSLGSSTQNENDTITKFELMDGAPVRGESIPVRLYLNGFNLTPTYRNVNIKFSTRYYLNLVLVDEEDRRYFKQQEITIWRNKIG